MRSLLCFLLSLNGLCADIHDIIDRDQTFVNDFLLGKGLVVEIMTNNLGAVRCVQGCKVYLKPDRITANDRGLMLIGDDNSLIVLPKVYSDQFGCYIRSALICTSCAYQYTADSVPIGCPQCRSD